MSAPSKIEAKFDALGRCERIFLACVIGVVLVLLLWFLQLKLLLAEKQQITRQQIRADRELSALQSKNRNAQQRLQENLDIELQNKLSHLQAQNLQLDESLTTQLQALVTPAAMPQLLEQVLAKTKGLRLLSMTSLPPEPLLDQETRAHLLYRHPIRLRFSGKFFAVIEFLTALEALPRQYYWRRLDYQVAAYPNAQVVLELYTLGKSTVFIGGKQNAGKV
ncbi:MAG: type 4a pilus biogenesis protein PilO [Vibrionaceae bacterium]